MKWKLLNQKSFDQLNVEDKFLLVKCTGWLISEEQKNYAHYDVIRFMNGCWTSLLFSEIHAASDTYKVVVLDEERILDLYSHYVVIE